MTPLKFFLNLNEGETMWFSTQGNSLWPWVLSGDEIEVQKIDESQFRIGELVLVQFENETLVAHLVASLNPLVTVSSVGVFDHNIKGLGRVTKVKKYGSVIEIPNWFPQVGKQIPNISKLAKLIPGARRLVRWIRRP